MTKLESLLHDALKLPADERGVLIQRLIESLEGPAGSADDDAEDVWAEVIARRIADLEAGRARIVDAKSAIGAAREELARRRRG
ncbi:MAG: addiction module protein [Planctomycetes bacterium]|nr:addiction module protein [Planctomycetota bacterium]